jgi:hypothetical protein
MFTDDIYGALDPGKAAAVRWQTPRTT